MYTCRHPDDDITHSSNGDHYVVFLSRGVWTRTWRRHRLMVCQSLLESAASHGWVERCLRLLHNNHTLTDDFDMSPHKRGSQVWKYLSPIIGPHYEKPSRPCSYGKRYRLSAV